MLDKLESVENFHFRTQFGVSIIKAYTGMFMYSGHMIRNKWPKYCKMKARKQELILKIVYYMAICLTFRKKVL